MAVVPSVPVLGGVTLLLLVWNQINCNNKISDIYTETVMTGGLLLARELQYRFSTFLLLFLYFSVNLRGKWALPLFVLSLSLFSVFCCGVVVSWWLTLVSWSHIRDSILRCWTFHGCWGWWTQALCISPCGWSTSCCCAVVLGKQYEGKEGKMMSSCLEKKKKVKKKTYLGSFRLEKAILVGVNRNVCRLYVV